MKKIVFMMVAGTPYKFTDLAIITCHGIRQVFHLALRQCQGFLNSIFVMKELNLSAFDYSCLSKRLSSLKISVPRYKNTDPMDRDIAAIAIDSTGLKRFGRDEWHQEKYELSAKRSWRKLHIAVDDKHVIHAAVLTDPFVSDNQVVSDLSDQIENEVLQITADGSYDKNPAYHTPSEFFTSAEIIIPPDRDAVYHGKNHVQRNLNRHRFN